MSVLEDVFKLLDDASGLLIEARGCHNAREGDAFQDAQTAALQALTKAMSAVEDELARLDKAS